MVAAIDPAPLPPERGPGAAELRENILAAASPAPARRARRTRWAVVIPAAGALAVAGVIGASLLPPGRGTGGSDPAATTGRPGIGPQAAAAATLRFEPTGDGGYKVTVKDLYADPERYRAEFRKRGFDIRLSFTPASPSLAGRLVFAEDPGTGKPIEHVIKDCDSPGGGCAVSLKIPAGYRGPGALGFARPAKPGEQYSSAGLADAPGELLHCVKWRNLTVDDLRAVLAKKNAKIAEFRVNMAKSEPAADVPGDWRVHDVAPWAPGEVLVWADERPAELTPEQRAAEDKALASCD
ncbi:hypothetical protein D5H75_16035 [Bailinhaonella thermotolerans]|uniref:Uncharacterized protein n=2 Tax=Bailinhaonella thermotolerans TaxID=1070861 RepID=A0A3A4AX43_9ACTN|nr:hypothetical protein D5H75_16035 [Bailinhaonella thermotolerans]